MAAEDPLHGLEDRLANHAKAFDSLLALTPARDYYGSHIDDGRDPSEQWNAKKQTKEQKRAAKKAKLDPANQKSALDVMREREGKRKRDMGGDEEDTTEKTKILKGEVDEDAAEARGKAIAEKRREHRQQKKERKAMKDAKAKAKKEARKAAKQNEDLADALPGKEQPRDDDEMSDNDVQEAEGVNDSANLNGLDITGLVESQDDIAGEEHEVIGKTSSTSNMAKLDLSGLAELEDENDDDDEAAEASSVPTSPVIDSPAFDLATNQSDASSSSSVPPVSVDGDEKPSHSLSSSLPESKPEPITLSRRKPAVPTASATTKPADPTSGTSSPKLQLPNVDPAILQERLRKRIEELRARRKADGEDGKQPRSRQELLEQRRKKEEQRKAHKKELRRQAKEEEAQKREAQLRGSGSPSSADFFKIGSPRPQQENSFGFSRLAFEDGTAADASLSSLQDPKKKKGPQDARTALEAAQKKQSRLSGLDAEKRADIAEKDMWLNAKKHTHGERVRDDTNLLKKALKRKEKQKDKSEKEWKEREQAVIKGREMKQKKREANLQKRKDEKGGGKGKSKPSAKGGKKKAGKAGFEGAGWRNFA